MTSPDISENSQGLRKIFGEVAQALREGHAFAIAKNVPGMASGHLRRDRLQREIAQEGYPVTE